MVYTNDAVYYPESIKHDEISNLRLPFKVWISNEPFQFEILKMIPKWQNELCNARKLSVCLKFAIKIFLKHKNLKIIF